jgi:hypothetical protein
MSMKDVCNSLQEYSEKRTYTASKELRDAFYERMIQEGSEGYFGFLLNGAYGEPANTFFYFAAYEGGKTRKNWKAIAFYEVAYAEGVCEDTGRRLSPMGAAKVWRSLPQDVKDRLNKALDELILEYPLPGRFRAEYSQQYGVQ